MILDSLRNGALGAGSGAVHRTLQEAERQRIEMESLHNSHLNYYQQ